jgi:hypothetical protein
MKMKRQTLGAAAGALFLLLCSGIAAGPSRQAGATGSDTPLRDVTSFDAIADSAKRSKALFEEAARVLTHPRCINCHPATRYPTQGDDLHAHIPPMNAGESGFGPDGMACTTCHGAENRTIVGSRIGSVPGAEPWLLAPASMAWQGLSVGEICMQVKDPERNGDRSLEDLVHHMSDDHLVAWAWHPGDGRTPAPGSQAAFGALIAAWVTSGAQCPD